MQKIILFSIMLFVYNSWATITSPPTDWQLTNLKDKVEKMSLLRINADGTKEIEITSFTREGYGKLKYYYNYNKEDVYTISPDDLSINKFMSYGDYTYNSRFLYFYPQFEEKGTMHAKEEWMHNDSEALCTRMYLDEDKNSGYVYQAEKLRKRIERAVTYVENQTVVWTRITSFEYNMEGDLIKEQVMEEINSKRREFTIDIDIRSKDQKGNVLLQTKRYSDSGDQVTEQMEYEYFK